MNYQFTKYDYKLLVLNELIIVDDDDDLPPIWSADFSETIDEKLKQLLFKNSKVISVILSCINTAS